MGKTMFVPEHYDLCRNEEHSEIRRQTAEFERRGGKVKHCEFGETAQFGKPYNPSNIPDPTVTHKRAAGKANQAHGQKKAAIGRAKMTTPIS